MPVCSSRRRQHNIANQPHSPHPTHAPRGLQRTTCVKPSGCLSTHHAHAARDSIPSALALQCPPVPSQSSIPGRALLRCRCRCRCADRRSSSDAAVLLLLLLLPPLLSNVRPPAHRRARSLLPELLCPRAPPPSCPAARHQHLHSPLHSHLPLHLPLAHARPPATFSSLSLSRMPPHQG